MKSNGINPLLTFFNRMSENDIYRKAAGLLLKNMRRVGSMTIQQAGDTCFTSGATVSRLSRRAGYEGYNDMKDAADRCCKSYFTENRLLPPDAFLDDEADTTEVYLTQVAQLYELLLKTIDKKAISKAAQLINEAESVCFFSAAENVRHIQQDLFYMGKYAEVFSFFEKTVEVPESLSKGGLAVIELPGYPGYGRDDLFAMAKECGSKIILITCATNQELEARADLAIRFRGTKSGMDEINYHAIMSLISLEYRRRYMDSWYYK